MVIRLAGPRAGAWATSQVMGYNTAETRARLTQASASASASASGSAYGAFTGDAKSQTGAKLKTADAFEPTGAMADYQLLSDEGNSPVQKIAFERIGKMPADEIEKLALDLPSPSSGMGQTATHGPGVLAASNWFDEGLARSDAISLEEALLDETSLYRAYLKSWGEMIVKIALSFLFVLALLLVGCCESIAQPFVERRRNAFKMNGKMIRLPIFLSSIPLALFGVLIPNSVHAQFARAEGEFQSEQALVRLLLLDAEKGVVAASVSVAVAPCSGAVTGIGNVKDRKIEFGPYESLQGGEKCRVALQFDGKWASLKISDNGQCNKFHGASCTWDGEVVKRKRN